MKIIYIKDLNDVIHVIFLDHIATFYSNYYPGSGNNFYELIITFSGNNEKCYRLDQKSYESFLKTIVKIKDKEI